MKVLDPGHLFLLDNLDGNRLQFLQFVKRNNPPEKYPGNTSAYPGTNVQEVLRALISRMNYLQGQNACCENEKIVDHLKHALYELEVRAHVKHGSILTASIEEVVTMPTCHRCGHVECTWCAA